MEHNLIDYNHNYYLYIGMDKMFDKLMRRMNQQDNNDDDVCYNYYFQN